MIAPANTGNDNSNKNAVIKIDQTNKGNLWKGILFVRMLKIVQIKLIAPNNRVFFKHFCFALGPALYLY